MIKLKPINISNYFAPPGGGYKIADWNALPRIPVKSLDIPAAASIAASCSMHVEKDNTWIYVLIGGAIVVGGLYLLHRYNTEEEEKDKLNYLRKT